MSDYEKAEFIAEAVQNWTKHNEIITADDVLRKCSGEHDLDWWYYRIMSLKR